MPMDQNLLDLQRLLGDRPPVEILEEILLPIKWTVDRIWWWGFKDGAVVSGLVFLFLFFLTQFGRRS